MPTVRDVQRQTKQIKMWIRCKSLCSKIERSLSSKLLIGRLLAENAIWVSLERLTNSLNLHRTATKFVCDLLSEEQKENSVNTRHVILYILDLTDIQSVRHWYAIVGTVMNIPVSWKLMNIFTN